MINSGDDATAVDSSPSECVAAGAKLKSYNSNDKQSIEKGLEIMEQNYKYLMKQKTKIIRAIAIQRLQI